MAVEDTSSMMAEIDKTVREHLPEKVGKLLRERLDQLTKLERTNKDQAEQLEDLDEKRYAADKVLARESSVERAEQAAEEAQATLEEKQQAVAIKEAVCEARKTAYADMKEIVLAVFANSRFKYQYSESGMTPGRDGSGYPVQESMNRNGEVEGEGPTPAVPAP